MGRLWYANVGTIFATYNEAVRACELTDDDIHKHGRIPLEFRIFGVSKR